MSAADEDQERRWQVWFQRLAEPLFILNRRRRLLFVNRAWEALTGLLLREVRGQPCRRRPRVPPADKTEQILSTLAPPPEAFNGPCQLRRLLPIIGKESLWVSVSMFPLGKGDELRGFLGTLQPLPLAPAMAQQPVPEKLLALRDRRVFSVESLAGQSAEMHRLVEQVRLAGRSPGLPILFTGQRGTGKLWLARVVHQLSDWRERFFACVECDLLPAPVSADFLAGLENGQSPVTVVLFKQPAALPRELQMRLAALLDQQREEPRLWLLASLTMDPRDEVGAGRLLEDLHSRLATLVIPVPPLTERRADLPELATRLLARLQSLREGPLPTLSAAALDVLRAHSWPGNLHELGEVLAAACGRCGSSPIEVDHLPLYLRAAPVPPERTLPLDDLLEKVERRLIELALRLGEGSKTKASELLGIWRARFLRRMEGLHIGGAADDS